VNTTRFPAAWAFRTDRTTALKDLTFLAERLIFVFTILVSSQNAKNVKRKA